MEIAQDQSDRSMSACAISGIVDPEEKLMAPGFDYHKQAPQSIAPLLQLESYLGECGVDHRPLPLLKTRNRLAVTFQPIVGSYQPRSTAARHKASS